MKCQTLFVIVAVFGLLYLVVQYYSSEFYKKMIESIQYGIPRMPSPLKIYQDQQDHFSQTMQDELATIGPYTSSPSPRNDPQQQAFDQCIQVCDQKMNKCIAAGNPTSCEYNYRICRQDCGWTSRQLIAPQ